MSTAERVAAYLRSCDMRRVDRNTVARALAMSGSTLRRRLIDEGVGFSVLVKAERMRRCQEAFSGGRRVKGRQLMQACGYTEINSFFRAFQSWYGVGYVQYRKQFFPATLDPRTQVQPA